MNRIQKCPREVLLQEGYWYMEYLLGEFFPLRKVVHTVYRCDQINRSGRQDPQKQDARLIMDLNAYSLMDISGVTFLNCFLFSSQF